MVHDKKSNTYKDAGVKISPRKYLPMSPKDRKEFEKIMKEVDEQIRRFSGAKAGKKMATDEFRLSMKKLGAVDKYHKQEVEHALEKKRQDMNNLQEILEKEYKDIGDEAKKLTGKPLDPTKGPTVRKIMAKEYREKIKKGGKIKKKYANGGTIRKPNRV